MPIYFGNSNISEIYAGNAAIVAIYRGTELLWEKFTDEPTPEPDPDVPTPDEPEEKYYTLSINQNDMYSFDICYKIHGETTIFKWERNTNTEVNSIEIPAGAEVWIENPVANIEGNVGFEISGEYWSSFDADASCYLSAYIYDKDIKYILKIDLPEWQFPSGIDQTGYYYDITVYENDTVKYELKDAQNKADQYISEELSISDTSNITAIGKFSSYVTEGHFEDATEPLNVQLNYQEAETIIDCYINITR